MGLKSDGRFLLLIGWILLVEGHWNFDPPESFNQYAGEGYQSNEQHDQVRVGCGKGLLLIHFIGLA
jgi:hypothetical protein